MGWSTIELVASALGVTSSATVSTCWRAALAVSLSVVQIVLVVLVDLVVPVCLCILIALIVLIIWYELVVSTLPRVMALSLARAAELDSAG